MTNNLRILAKKESPWKAKKEAEKNVQKTLQTPSKEKEDIFPTVTDEDVKTAEPLGPLTCRRGATGSTLDTYQTDVLKGILKFEALLLCFDMGSGKTATALCAAENLLIQGVIKDVYLICPKAASQQWIDEANAWGCKRTAEKLEDKQPANGVVKIQNWGGPNLLKPPANCGNSLMIIDEVHMMRKSTSQVYQQWEAILAKPSDKFKKVLMLSGTPCYDSVGDMKIILKTLNPKVYNQFIKTETARLKTVGVDLDKYFSNSDKLTQEQFAWLSQMTRCRVMVHRRDLKHYAKMVVRPAVEYVMTKEHEALYDLVKNSTTSTNPFNIKTRLACLAVEITPENKHLVKTSKRLVLERNDARKDMDEDDEIIYRTKKTYAKNASMFYEVIGYERIYDILSRCKTNIVEHGKKCVVFSEFYFGIDIIVALIEQNPDFYELKKLYSELSGRNNAAQVQKDFNDGVTKLLLITKASATGVNLNETNQIYIMQPVYVPGLRSQVMSRIWRRGSHANLNTQISLLEYRVKRDGVNLAPNLDTADKRVAGLLDGKLSNIKAFEQHLYNIWNNAKDQCLDA